MNLLQGSRGKVKLRIFGDYVRGKIDGGNDLECINLPRLGTGLDCVFNRFHVNVELTNVFKQEDVGPLETETDGYNMLDTQLTYQVHKKMNLGRRYLLKVLACLTTMSVNIVHLSRIVRLLLVGPV